MLPYFVIDQIAFGPIRFYTWGLFVGLGFSAGYLWFYYLARQKGLAPIKIAGLALTIFIGAILGAKILSWALAGGGAMFMGGLAGAIICSVLYVLLVKLDLWRVADLLVLPALLGIAIGRIGCSLINDHQGAITNLPWGIIWPDGIARHPVAIYEMLAAFGLLAGFWFFYRVIPAKAGIQDSGPGSRLKAGTTKNGQLFLSFLLTYSFLRFLLDFTRAASGPLLADPRWGALSVSQWMAGGIFFVSLSLFIYRKRC